MQLWPRRSARRPRRRLTAGPRGQTVHYDNFGVTLSVRPTVSGHFGRHDSGLLDQHGGAALPAATGFAATVLPQGAAMLLPAVQAARERR